MFVLWRASCFWADGGRLLGNGHVKEKWRNKTVSKNERKKMLHSDYVYPLCLSSITVLLRRKWCWGITEWWFGICPHPYAADITFLQFPCQVWLQVESHFQIRPRRRQTLPCLRWMCTALLSVSQHSSSANMDLADATTDIFESELPITARIITPWKRKRIKWII